MKTIFASLLMVWALSGKAQVLEVGYAPTSFRGWGQLPETTKFEVSVLFRSWQSHSFQYTPGVRYSNIRSESRRVDELGDMVNGRFNILFLLPISFNIDLGKTSVINRMGVGLSDQVFPNENGRYVNFLLETGLTYAVTEIISISLRYSHISNGYRGQTNPGLDNIVLGTGLYF